MAKQQQQARPGAKQGPEELTADDLTDACGLLLFWTKQQRLRG